MTRASRPHAEAVIELLRADPAFADEYLQATLAQADEKGGREALLSALRHVAEARGHPQRPKQGRYIARHSERVTVSRLLRCIGR